MGAVNYYSFLQGAASLKRLGNTGLPNQFGSHMETPCGVHVTLGQNV